MSKRLLMVILSILLVVVLIGCTNVLLQTTFKVDIEPDNGGSVSPANGTVFENQAKITVTVTPNEGYEFSHWGGDHAEELISTNDEHTWNLVMDTNKSLVAFFTELPTNQPPTVSLTATPLSGIAPLEVNFSAEANDSDGDLLTYTWTFPGAEPFSNENSEQSHTFTETGTYEVSVSVDDGNGGVVTDTVTITVDPNQLPAAVDDTSTTEEDTPVSIDVLANDTDADGDSFAITEVTAGSNGTVDIETGGNVSYTPDMNFYGTDTFTYSIVDDHGGTGNGTVTVTITPVNDDPVLNSIGDQRVQENEELTFSVAATDVDGDTLNYTFTSEKLPVNLFDEATQIFSYTPDFGASGEYTGTFGVSDGNVTITETITITVENVDRAPVLNLIGAQTVTESQTLNFTVTASDPDGDPVILTTSELPTGADFAPETGEFSWTPTYDQAGEYTITVTATANDLTDSETVMITVNNTNREPVAVDDELIINEDTQASINVLENDSDSDGDLVTLSSFSTPLFGSLSEMETGILTYTPDANYHGTDSFDYQISDNLGGVGSATVTITVNSVNDAPQLDLIGDYTVRETDTVNFTITASDVDEDDLTYSVQDLPEGAQFDLTTQIFNWVTNYGDAGTYDLTFEVTDGIESDSEIVTIIINDKDRAPILDPITNQTIDENSLLTFTVNASDPDGDPVILTTSELPTGADFTSETGEFSWTPTYEQAGEYQLTFAATANGLKDESTITVTVVDVNRPPVVVDDQVEVDEDTSVLVSPLSNDSDPDGDVITLTAFSEPSHGTVNQEGDGLRYTPDADYNGTDSFTYDIADGKGGTATATVNVTINSINDAPIAADDSAVIDEDGTVLIDVLSNDTDVEEDVVAITGFTQATNGTVTQEGNSLRYTPDADFNGTDSFTYDVGDSNGGVTTAIVNVTINAINDSPVATDDSAVVDEDGTVLIDVLINDTDIDEDTLSITGFGVATNGAVAQEGNSLRYTPDADYNGTDSFTYDIADGTGGIATATVNVTINSINDAPAAVDDSGTVDQNSSVLIDVLGNDTDKENDSLTISSFTQGTNGTVAQEGDSLRYTPDADYIGTDNFTYVISDGNSGVATATVNITIEQGMLIDVDIDVAINGDSANCPVYEFTVDSSGFYIIDTDLYQIACDTIVILYDSGMNIIEVNDDYEDLYGHIEMVLNPGTYYVEVQDFDMIHLRCTLQVYEQ